MGDTAAAGNVYTGTSPARKGKKGSKGAGGVGDGAGDGEGGRDRESKQEKTERGERISKGEAEKREGKRDKAGKDGREARGEREQDKERAGLGSGGGGGGGGRGGGVGGKELTLPASKEDDQVSEKACVSMVQQLMDPKTDPAAVRLVAALISKTGRLLKTWLMDAERRADKGKGGGGGGSVGGGARGDSNAAAGKGDMPEGRHTRLINALRKAGLGQALVAALRKADQGGSGTRTLIVLAEVALLVGLSLPVSLFSCVCVRERDGISCVHIGLGVSNV